MNNDLKPYKNILANVARHVTLSEEEKIFFCSLLRPKKLRKRQYLLQEGDVSRYETFVDKGLLRTYFLDNNGTEHIIQFSPENWWTNDLVSFNTGKPSKLSIDALEDSELFQLDKPGMDLLFERIPKFEKFYRIQFQNALISVSDRLISHLAESAEERYLELSEHCIGLENRIPLKYIASYLGVTPEFLSRLRRKLAKKKPA